MNYDYIVDRIVYNRKSDLGTMSPLGNLQESTYIRMITYYGYVADNLYVLVVSTLIQQISYKMV